MEDFSTLEKIGSVNLLVSDDCKTLAKYEVENKDTIWHQRFYYGSNNRVIKTFYKDTVANIDSLIFYPDSTVKIEISRYLSDTTFTITKTNEHLMYSYSAGSKDLLKYDLDINGNPFRKYLNDTLISSFKNYYSDSLLVRQEEYKDEKLIRVKIMEKTSQREVFKEYINDSRLIRGSITYFDREGCKTRIESYELDDLIS